MFVYMMLGGYKIICAWCIMMTKDDIGRIEYENGANQYLQLLDYLHNALLKRESSFNSRYTSKSLRAAFNATI